jgi:hypothetical protein
MYGIVEIHEHYAGNLQKIQANKIFVEWCLLGCYAVWLL